MAKRGKFNTRRRPDMRGIEQAARVVARSRSGGYEDMSAVEYGEIGAHVPDSMVRQPNRRAIPRSTLTLILQRADADRDIAWSADQETYTDSEVGYEYGIA